MIDSLEGVGKANVQMLLKIGIFQTTRKMIKTMRKIGRMIVMKVMNLMTTSLTMEKYIHATTRTNELSTGLMTSVSIIWPTKSIMMNHSLLKIEFDGMICHTC